MKINFLKLFGIPDKLSDVTNTPASVSSIEAPILSKIGVEPTTKGAVNYIELAVDSAIQSENKLNEDEKLVLTALVNGLANKFN